MCMQLKVRNQFHTSNWKLCSFHHLFWTCAYHFKYCRYTIVQFTLTKMFVIFILKGFQISDCFGFELSVIPYPSEPQTLIYIYVIYTESNAFES